MIALFSFNPLHCPVCGRSMAPRPGSDPEIAKMSEEDFFAGCACTCQGCGLHYAYADAELIRQLAAQTGDMGRYVPAGGAE
jgi:hypothetical protein